MPAPDISRLDAPLPAYRGLLTVTTGTADVEFDKPRTVRVITAGAIVFTDSLGTQHTFSGLIAGADIVGPGGGLVYVIGITATGTTVTSVLTGIV